MTSPTGVLFVDPQAKPLSTVGQFQAAAYLLFYLTGTTTPANVYADGLLATPLSQVPGTSQPSCTADSAGRFNPIYLNPATLYRVQMYTALGVKIEDTDPYVPTPFNQALFNAFSETMVFTGAALDGTNNTMFVTRNAGYTGGTNGYVNTAVRIITNVTGAASASDEWPLLAVLNNSSLGTTGSQNTALYAQGNKMVASAGDTWAATLESDDLSGAANPVYSQVGCEIDVWANGTDNNGVRLGLGIYVGPPPSLGGTAPVCNTGIFIGPVNASPTQGSYFQGIHLLGIMSFGINFDLTAGAGTAINTSNAVLSGAALRIGAAQHIGFDSSDGHTIGYNVGDGGLLYTVSGNQQIILLDTGGLILNQSGTQTKIPGTVTANGSATPALTGNKPGSTTAIQAWADWYISGTHYVFPLYSPT